MLNYPVIYFLIAVGSAGLAFTGTATGSVETVRALFVLFALAAVVTSLVPRRTPPRERAYGTWDSDNRV